MLSNKKYLGLQDHNSRYPMMEEIPSYTCINVLFFFLGVFEHEGSKILTTILLNIWAQIMRYHNIMRLMGLLNKEDRWQKILKSWVHGGAKGNKYQIGEWLVMLTNECLVNFSPLFSLWQIMLPLFLTVSSSVLSFSLWRRTCCCEHKFLINCFHRIH